MKKKSKDTALLTLDSKIVQVLPFPPAQRERSGRPGSRPPGKWVLVGHLPLASGDKHGSVSPATLELVLKRKAAFNASPSCCNQCLVPWTIQSLQTFQAERTTRFPCPVFYVTKPFGWKYILQCLLVSSVDSVHHMKSAKATRGTRSLKAEEKEANLSLEPIAKSPAHFYLGQFTR